MRTSLPIIKFARMATLAAVVGAAALTTMPAQAQPFMHRPGMQGQFFQRPFPHRQFFHRPFIRPFFPAYPVYPIYPVRPVCMPDWQLRRAINAAGYYNVAIYGGGAYRVQATAMRGPWVYRLTVNRCSGAILGAYRIRHR